MRTQKHKLFGLLATAVMSLALCACGGGGGGGGGSESNGEEGGSQSSDNSTHRGAPDSLAQGQCFIATIGGETIELPIVSSARYGNKTAGNIIYQGKEQEFRYEKTGQNTATFRWLVNITTSPGYGSTIASSTTVVNKNFDEYTCDFTSSNSGQISQFRKVVHTTITGLSKKPVEPGKTGTFRITGNSIYDTPSGSNTSNGSSSDSSGSSGGSGNSSTVVPVLPDYAPNDITGYWLSLPYTISGIKDIILDIQGTAFVTPAVTTLFNTYEYKKLEKNKASLKVTCRNNPSQNLDVTLTFTSTTKVTMEGKIGSTPISASATYSSGHESTEWNPPSEDNSSSNAGGGNSNTGNNTGNDSISGYAPSTLDGNYFTTSNGSTMNGIRHIGFSGNKVTLQPANVSGTYTYTRSTTDGNAATLSIDCTGSNYDSNKLTLQFTSANKLQLHGTINGSTYTLAMDMIPGKVDLTEDDDNSSSSGGSVTGWAPKDLKGYTIRFNKKIQGQDTFRFVSSGSAESNTGNICIVSGIQWVDTKTIKIEKFHVSRRRYDTDELDSLQAFEFNNLTLNFTSAGGGNVAGADNVSYSGGGFWSGTGVNAFSIYK